MTSPIRNTPYFPNGDNFHDAVKAETSTGVEGETPVRDVEFETLIDLITERAIEGNCKSLEAYSQGLKSTMREVNEIRNSEAFS